MLLRMECVWGGGRRGLTSACTQSRTVTDLRSCLCACVHVWVVEPFLRSLDPFVDLFLRAPVNIVIDTSTAGADPASLAGNSLLFTYSDAIRRVLVPKGELYLRLDAAGNLVPADDPDAGDSYLRAAGFGDTMRLGPGSGDNGSIPTNASSTAGSTGRRLQTTSTVVPPDAAGSNGATALLQLVSVTFFVRAGAAGTSPNILEPALLLDRLKVRLAFRRVLLLLHVPDALPRWPRCSVRSRSTKAPGDCLTELAAHPPIHYPPFSTFPLEFPVAG
jgi:hypothetical protein